MAEDAALNLRIEATLARFERNMEQARRRFSTTAAKMESRAQRLDTRFEAVGKGFGGAMGPRLQQVGFQVGDFATQVSGGTSAITALTQQGTQLLGSFGPWGAVIGAAGAVVGALAANMFDAAKDAKTLEERVDEAGGAVSDFRDSARLGSEGIGNLIENYGRLDRQILNSISLQRELNEAAARSGLTTLFKGAQDEAEDIGGAIALGLSTGQAEALRGQFGLADDAARQFGSAFADLRDAATFDQRADAIEALSGALAANVTVTDELNPKFRDFIGAVNEANLALREFRQGQREAAETAELLSRPVAEINRLGAAAEAGTRRQRDATAGLQGQINELVDGEVRRYNEAVAESAAANRAALEAADRLAQSNAQIWSSAFDQLTRAASGARDFEDALKRVGIQLAELVAQGAIGQGPFAGVLNAAFGLGGGTNLAELAGAQIGSLFRAPAAPAAAPLAPVRSFAGGGSTGAGARSGGLDGQGGFLAMLHPRETVIDHTRSGSTGSTTTVAPVVNIHVDGDATPETVQLIRTEVAGALADFSRRVPDLAADGGRRSPTIRRSFS